LGETILRLKVHPKREDDDVIDEDIIIFWDKSKRIITGSDILGRLLKNIVQKEKVHFRKKSTNI
jgi:metal transporter CNNM